MYIALSDELLKDFLNFHFNNKFDKDTISNLLKYIHPFSINRKQLSNFDQSIQKSIINGNPFINTSNTTNETELINSTKYKLMLTTNNNTYPYINIMEDEIDNNYTATYKANDCRCKAKKHIKALLSSAKHITIIDNYLFSKETKSNQWNNNFTILKYILPNKKITIFCNQNITQSHITGLKTYNSLWTIKKYKENTKNIHDRYIKTDKLEILLSSGLEYLEDKSKDFTYIVKEL
jgi:hypothetical protein